jgi:raffinose/stachyose/melibiose transport system permease protein
MTAASRAGESGPVRAGRRAGPASRTPYLLYLAPGLVLFVAVIGVPLIVNIATSLSRWDGVGRPVWIGLANYRQLFTDTVFWASFRHNAALIFAMAIVPTFVGLVLAYILFDFVSTRFGARTASILRACFYLPQVLPIVVAGIVWSWILAPDNGALNTLLARLGLGSLAQNWLGDEKTALLSVMGVMVWVQIGFPLVVFMGALQRVDPSLYEAAEIDGASWWRRFQHVTVPQIRPEIFVVLLWCTIAALKVFAPIYVLTRGGPGGATNVPSYFSFQNFFDKTQVGYGAAIATVLTMLIVMLTALFLRVQGRPGEANG